MPLVIPDMANAMMNAIDGMSTPIPSIVHVLCVAIGDYIVDNATLTFAWTATCPGTPPFPDPQVIAMGEVTSHSISGANSWATVPAVGLTHLADRLTSEIQSTMEYNITEPGFLTTSLSMVDFPPLTLVLGGIPDRVTAFTLLATQICTHFWLYVPAIPCAGLHGACVGVGSVVSIL